MATARKIPGVNAKVISRSSHSSVSVKDSAHSTGAGVVLAVGGHQFPARTEPRCKVCQSPLRADFELGLSRQLSPARVLKRVDQEDLPEDLRVKSPESLRIHADRHMSMDQAVASAVGEAWQRKLGLNPDEEDTIVTHVGLIDLVMQRAFEGIANGTLMPNVNEGLSAAKMMMEFEGRLNAGNNNDAYLDVLNTYLQVARDVLPPEQLLAFGEALSQHPLMSQMVEKEGVALNPVIDADAWEEDDDDEWDDDEDESMS